MYAEKTNSMGSKADFQSTQNSLNDMASLYNVLAKCSMYKTKTNNIYTVCCSCSTYSIAHYTLNSVLNIRAKAHSVEQCAVYK